MSDIAEEGLGFAIIYLTPPYFFSVVRCQAAVGVDRLRSR